MEGRQPKLPGGKAPRRTTSFSLRPPLTAGALGSLQSRSSPVSAPLTSSSTAAALALTSKQRLLGDDTLRSVAQLLRLTASHIEAASLQEVMVDPVASEYITANGSRGDEPMSSATPVGASVAPFLSSPFDCSATSPLSSSESAVDAAANALAQFAGIEATTPVTLGGTATPPLRHQGGAANAVYVPPAPCPTTSTASRLRSSRSSLPSVDLGRRPRASLDVTPVEHALRLAAAAAAAVSDANYTFPSRWYSPPEAGAAPPLRPRPSLTKHTGLSAATKRNSVGPVKGFRPHWATAGSFSTVTAPNSSSVPASRSQSLGTAVFLQTPSPSNSPNLRTRPNSSSTRQDAFHVSAVATAQPPLFLDNMLFDPATSRYLFDGHAFREEARVLLVPPAPDLVQSPSSTAMSGSGDSDASGPGGRGNGHARKIARALPHAATLLLVREYIPVLAASGGGGGGGSSAGEEMRPGGQREVSGADVVVVQCFSLLPPQLGQVRPNRYQLLPEAATTGFLLAALPGCVTLATPWRAFLREERRSLLTIASSPLERLLATGHDSQSRRLTANAARAGGAPLQPRASVAATLPPFSDSGSSIGSVTASGRASESPPLVETAERVAARVAVVDECLLQTVPPDVLDEALQAIQSVLAQYCMQYEQRLVMCAAVDAVPVLQRFFRRCLTVKGRAVARMLRLWRRLEVEARVKLQQHRNLPAAVERMDAVANTILQEHMLTSPAYKRAFIEDRWAARRLAFARWKEEEAWNAVVATAARPPEASSGTDGVAEAAPGNGGGARGGSAGSSEAGSSRVGSATGTRPPSAWLTLEDQQRLERAFHQRRSAPGVGGAAQQCAASLIEPAGGERQSDHYRAVLRRFLSWYMEPQELLYLSHQRLLETLKSSVFRMVEVQNELKRAALDLTEVESAEVMTASTTLLHSSSLRR